MNKYNRNKHELVIDYTFSAIISIIFSIIIGEIFPSNDRLDEIIKNFFVVWLSIISFIFITNYLIMYKDVHCGKRHPYFTITFTVLVFPFLINCIISENVSEYLKRYPDDNLATFAFDVNIEMTKNTGVGNKIHKISFINDNRITGGGNVSNIVTVRVDEPIVVKTRITESDESVPDIAEKIYNLKYYCDNKDKLDYTIWFEQNIRLYEKGGRINSGAVADFTARYTVKRVVPDLKAWFSLLFYVDENLDYLWLALVALSGFSSLNTINKTVRANNELERKRIEEHKNRVMMKEHS